MESASGIRNGGAGGHKGAFHALVLAAGAGRRFGGGKLTAPWRGRPLLSWAIDAARSAPVDTVTVLVQPGFPVDPAEGDGEGVGLGVRVREVGDWAEGIAASLRTGIAVLPPCAGAFIFLGDMPEIPLAILPELAQAVRAGAPAALPTFDGRAGHPVVLSSRLFPQILTLAGDRGARAILDRLGNEVAHIPTEDGGVLFDVDTVDDLQGRPAAD